MPLPRGIRNLNPTNIRKTAVQWQGEMQGPDPNFCTFTDAKYGIRAAMLLIRRYFFLRDLTTVSKIISRWAPEVENKTGHILLRSLST